jgi:hypothetical protein
MPREPVAAAVPVPVDFLGERCIRVMTTEPVTARSCKREGRGVVPATQPHFGPDPASEAGIGTGQGHSRFTGMRTTTLGGGVGPG